MQTLTCQRGALHGIRHRTLVRQYELMHFIADLLSNNVVILLRLNDATMSHGYMPSLHFHN